LVDENTILGKERAERSGIPVVKGIEIAFVDRLDLLPTEGSSARLGAIANIERTPVSDNTTRQACVRR
jgi:hypothetical protein